MDRVKIESCHGLMGCRHYSGPLDNVAIKLKCCDRYYPCYICHHEDTDHPIDRWQPEEFHTLAITCLCCHTQITIFVYLHCQAQCPHCQALFNPNCKLHWPLYFEGHIET